MDISPHLYFWLFLFCLFAGLGNFFAGIAYLWQVSLPAKAMKQAVRT